MKQYYEAYHEVEYTDEALDLAVDLAERYMHGKFNPDRAIDVVDVAGARTKLHGLGAHVRKEEIEQAVSKITRIPMDMIDAKENTNYANLDTNIKKNFWTRQSSKHIS